MDSQQEAHMIVQQLIAEQETTNTPLEDILDDLAGDSKESTNGSAHTDRLS